MLCQRRSTITNRAKGLTLLEVAISSGLFLMMSTVLFSLFQQSQKSTDKAIQSTDSTSRSLILFEKIRQETRGVRVLGPDPAGRLEYWKIRNVDGIPQLTALGRPDYLPGNPAAPDSAYLYLDQGLLKSDFQGDVRSLARVGKNSSLEFIWNAANHTLTLTGVIKIKGDSHGDNFFYRLYVSNNE